MARNPSTSHSSRSAVTAERVARLYQLIQFLGTGPKGRASLLRHLRLDMRGFYRDLEKLREFAISFELFDGRYVLMEPVDRALAKLPFPDPMLSVQEALILAKGKTSAHAKLREKINDLRGKIPKKVK